jgi:hypothetical protein
VIREEFERGDDLTPRLTRNFYKTGFNDFLFNTFGIQHMHLGVSGAAWDRTKKHPMSGGTDALLFVVVQAASAYFVDVVNHDVFESAELSKALVQTILRNWPEVLEQYRIPDVVGSDLCFEKAFKLAKSGFTVLFEVDGMFFARGAAFDGKVANGKRAAGTSMDVVDVTNRTLNMVVALVEFATREAASIAQAAKEYSGVRPDALDLEVARAGRVVVLREQNTGMEIVFNGDRIDLLHPLR